MSVATEATNPIAHHGPTLTTCATLSYVSPTLHGHQLQTAVGTFSEFVPGDIPEKSTFADPLPKRAPTIERSTVERPSFGISL